jgi:hypothetical protein
MLICILAILNTECMLTFLFADGHVIIHTKENLQKARYQIYKITDKFNVKSSNEKSKVMSFHGRTPVRSKVISEYRTFDQANTFDFLIAPCPGGRYIFQTEHRRF